MQSGKETSNNVSQAFEPLSNGLQLGTRVYQILLKTIVSGQIAPGAQLRPDAIARQLEVSTTPVREAMHRLENDGLAVKHSYQGWFVREHTKEEIRELYELRVALECLSVELACQRVTEDEIEWLRRHQTAGESALAAGDMDAYRMYNRDLHAAIIRAARNSYLSGIMGQLQSQSEMLIARTIRIIGRPLRAIKEHQRLIELIAARDAAEAGRLMSQHISSALEDIISSRGDLANR
jgi:DNA-binding GntR family transcriptional regulator